MIATTPTKSGRSGRTRSAIRPPITRPTPIAASTSPQTEAPPSDSFATTGPRMFEPGRLGRVGEGEAEHDDPDPGARAELPPAVPRARGRSSRTASRAGARTCIGSRIAAATRYVRPRRRRSPSPALRRQRSGRRARRRRCWWRSAPGAAARSRAGALRHGNGLRARSPAGPGRRTSSRPPARRRSPRAARSRPCPESRRYGGDRLGDSGDEIRADHDEVARAAGRRSRRRRGGRTICGRIASARTRPSSVADPPRSSTAKASATGAIAEPANETTRPRKRRRKSRCRSGASTLAARLRAACASSARARGSTGQVGAERSYASTSSGSDARQSARAGRHERRLVHAVGDPLAPAVQRLAQPGEVLRRRPRRRRSGSARAARAPAARSRRSSAPRPRDRCRAAASAASTKRAGAIRTPTESPA